MSCENDEIQRRIDRMNEKIENANRIDEIISTTEAYTRTERHLEQHSDINEPDNIRHTKEIQEKRKRDVENLKNKIVFGETFGESEYENLLENYAATEEYIEKNSDNLDKNSLKSLKRKQENREEKMNELK
ncbi:hypothetical protein [Clostridium grantii]|uniref:Uncharacterized protein n=1 Tax=Clostridium grantii DSM 8605 TaxID=1121316 RepID=A0A1M5XSM5_9CLOT|nr:hypothetical protein [Clostridium grantii]SHI02810.1 hypothetical protein SAMN02745207_03901 [Clostridium grantii DSM 8605]